MAVDCGRRVFLLQLAEKMDEGRALRVGSCVLGGLAISGAAADVADTY